MHNLQTKKLRSKEVVLLGPNGLNLLAALSPPWLFHCNRHTKKLLLSGERFSEVQENVLYDARISPNCPVGSSSRFYRLSFHTSHLLSRQHCACLLLGLAASCLWTSSQPEICSCLRPLQWSPNWIIYFFFCVF